jgi:hypothetical protein
MEDAARPSGASFSLGGWALRRGRATFIPPENQGDTLDHCWRISSAASAATISLDPAGIGAADANEKCSGFHGGD